MRVERFFLFFPPKVWSVKRGETEYGIGAIPLGGFVRITACTGMNPEEELVLASEEGPALEPAPTTPQPVWKRIVVIAAGPFVNLVLALRDPLRARVGFGARHRPTNTRRDASAEDPGGAASLQPGDQLVSVDGGEVGDAASKLADPAAPRSRPTSARATTTDGCAADEPRP